MTMAFLALSIMPAVMAAGIGTGLGGGVSVEEMRPIVWQCGGRMLLDEQVQPWRITGENNEMYERSQQYLFEGEKYSVDVVVFDKNKIDTVDVRLELEAMGAGDGEGDNEDYGVNCVAIDEVNFDDCNARIGEEDLESYNEDVMQSYVCSFTVKDSEFMYGEYDMRVEACPNEEQGDECGQYVDVAPWYMNPVISLSTGDATLDFETLDGEDILPGTTAYSNIVVKNNAEGGVLLDMFITGEDWQAVDSARCADENGDLQTFLTLAAFSYKAENGNWDTYADKQIDGGDAGLLAKYDQTDYDALVSRTCVNGFCNINKQLNAGFEEAMFDDAEIIQDGGPVKGNVGYWGNVLNPGSVGMPITFRLDMPEPCYGEFVTPSEGGFMIWAEAI